MKKIRIAIILLSILILAACQQDNKATQVNNAPETTTVETTELDEVSLEVSQETEALFVEKTKETEISATGLKDLEGYLLQKGLLNGEPIFVASEMIGAIDGFKYPDSKVEVYEYDTTGEVYKKLLSSGEVALDGFGNLTVDGINGAYIIFCKECPDKDAVLEAFNQYRE